MSLFRRLTARRLQNLSGTRQRRRQALMQGFEQLEARQLLATFTWSGAGADTNWTTSANWAQTGDADGIPDADDDLVFDANTAQRNSNNNLAAASAVNSITVNADGYS